MRRGMLAAAAALILAAAACGSDDGAGVRTIDGSGSTGGSGSAAGSGSGSASGSTVACVPGDVTGADATVVVALTEWAVDPEPDTVAAGRVAFTASNEHAALPHELVIVRGDDPTGLPTSPDGAVDESRLPEGALIGEIEVFPAGGTCEGAFDLVPGSYVLFCNIVETADDGTRLGHYVEGMTAAFTVIAD